MSCFKDDYNILLGSSVYKLFPFYSLFIDQDEENSSSLICPNTFHLATAATPEDVVLCRTYLPYVMSRIAKGMPSRTWGPMLRKHPTSQIPTSEIWATGLHSYTQTGGQRPILKERNCTLSFPAAVLLTVEVTTQMPIRHRLSSSV